jgi:topoisomerase-4 subunit A
MAYIKNLFDRNFLEYASYVIKDRAIPDLEDGLKPVQRRILHSLFEMDEGKFIKVANVVGHCMQYHPHGDASIGDALVVLANKDLFLEKQGNFGNIYTGDAASAARYIECRVTPLAKVVFHNPKLTAYVDSYDGRKKEPVLFPAKIPVVLAIGAEGIAVGMSTKILPHNLLEVLEAEKAALRGKAFALTPDFPTGGFVDASGYNDGNGKVLVRAKLDVSDPKKIVIRELPFGSTTESMMASIETASKAGKLKIASLNDYTTEHVEIEIKLQRGVYSEETVDALFAFTECEKSISCNLLVIKNGLPAVMSVTAVVQHHAKQLVAILTRELELEKAELNDKLHLRTLERIFIEEGVYKLIEKQKTAETVEKAVLKGFEPFAQEVGKRGISHDDIEHLLKIPIRRISLYDIARARSEREEILARIKAINALLKDVTGYAAGFLDSLIAKVKADKENGGGTRRTKAGRFEKTDVKAVVKKDVKLFYDRKTGYLGTNVSGSLVAECSPFDRILVVRKDGTYFVGDIPEKSFAGEGAYYIGVADKEALAKTVFTVMYREGKNGCACIKRCVIEGWIMNKEYRLVPEDAKTLHIDTRAKFAFTVHYKAKPRLRVLEETFRAERYEVKGLKAQGVRLSPKEAASVTLERNEKKGKGE